jgi:hypothetical protein
MLVKPAVILQSEMYFSYSQFLIYDSLVDLPGLSWTDVHTRQGFARCASAVNFATLTEFGNADLTVHLGPFVADTKYQRVIAVPFAVVSRKVMINGPEEFYHSRNVELEIGYYRVVAAQVQIGEEFQDAKQEAMDLFFQKLTEPMIHSEIVLADKSIRPPAELCETAEIA